MTRTSDSLLEYWRGLALAQHTSDTYAGVALAKFPEDLRVYEHLLWLQAPDTVIEVGTQFGGSALWFRDRLRILQSYGRIECAPLVVTIDTDQARARRALRAADPRYEEQITLVEGDVHGRRYRRGGARARSACGRGASSSRTLAQHLHDNARLTRSVRRARRRSAASWSSSDGCVDVEELRINDDWPTGVLPALDDWLATETGRPFVVRRDLELYGVSCHPRGFLQRASR